MTAAMESQELDLNRPLVDEDADVNEEFYENYDEETEAGDDGVGLGNSEGNADAGGGGSLLDRMLDDDNGCGEESDTEAEAAREPGVESALPDPTVGMEFTVVEDLIKYLKSYASQRGFEVGKRSIDLPKRTRGRIRPPAGEAGNRRTEYPDHTRARIVCSKFGVFKSEAKNPDACTQTGKTACLWGVNANRNPKVDEFWRITQVVLDHNHVCEGRNSRFLPSYRDVGPADGASVIEMTKAGIPVPQVYKFFVEKYKGYDRVPFTEKDMRNFIYRNYWQPLKTGDFLAMEAHFKKMKEESPNFFYEYDQDDKHRLKNVFWADARCVLAFNEFGDVVSFDTTFITNRYRMPFAPFVIVNHHGKSILVGCALLGAEDTDTFVWLFRSWRKCMGKDPKCIITDQSTPIGNAIKIVFPNAHHRWCIWHIRQNAKKHLGKLPEWREISQGWQETLHDSFTVPEFERRWFEWGEKFGIGNHPWVKEMFEKRERWVPAYFKNEFWAGMSSTQRSEGLNNFFKGFVNINTNLKLFCEKYGAAVCKRIEEEEQDCFKAVHRHSRMTHHHPFEEVFEALFTRSKFMEFRDELVDMGYNAGNIKSVNGSIVVYEVVVKQFRRVMTKKSLFTVKFDRSKMEVDCECKNFQFRGILCAHALRVFWCEETMVVPEVYLNLRWCKHTPRAYLKLDYPYRAMMGRQSMFMERYNSFSTECEDLGVSLMNNEEAYKEGLRCVRKLRKKLEDKYGLPEGIYKEVVGGNRLVYVKKSRRQIEEEGKARTEQRIWEEDDPNVVKDPVDKRGRGRGQTKRKKGAADYHTPPGRMTPGQPGLQTPSPMGSSIPGSNSSTGTPNYNKGYTTTGYTFSGHSQYPIWMNGFGNPWHGGGYKMNSRLVDLLIYPRQHW